MSRFWGGFIVASTLWAAALGYLVLVEGFALPSAPAPLPIAEEPVVEEPVEEEEAPRARRRRRARTAGARRGETPTGSATVGDDLREDEIRSLDMGGSGGEQQLSSAEIETAFDGAMGRIRRCLVLMEGDDAVSGRLTFGLRVASSGRVEAVQLSGPRAATTGEAGSCLQSAVRAISFPSFDGPTMVVRYPLTLE